MRIPAYMRLETCLLKDLHALSVFRMADFVSRAIDNVSHGLTVRAAMDSLGLKECVQFLHF